MVRPREFDPENALDSALQVFWAKGYEATSLDDLSEATGLNRSSLYGTFGNKRALYFSVLERYVRNGCAHIAEQLDHQPVQQAFTMFVQSLIDEIVAGPGRRGCFIGNCAAELVRRDRHAAGNVQEGLRSIESTFAAALERARAQGELPAEADVPGLARYLTSGIQGLRLVGKANPDRAALEDIARWMLRALETPARSILTQDVEVSA
jgi:TetR/AcrR family transcriptional repressor of nem operon